MRQFSANVRLSGSLYNAVFKSGLTIPEIILLRKIHGDDAIADIKETESVRRTSTEERERLVGVYGAIIAKREEITGGIGSLIGFAGEVPDGAPGIPAPKKGKAEDNLEG